MGMRRLRLWAMPLVLSAVAGCQRDGGGVGASVQPSHTQSAHSAFDWGQGQHESVAEAFGVVLPAATAATIYELVGVPASAPQQKRDQ